MSKLEKTFQTKLKKYLETKSYVVKFNASGISKVGVPDVLCCYKGLFIGIELKASNGKPSELQLYNLREIEKSGGISYLLYPKDFEKFKKDLESF